jgi:hypothetical protein
MVLFRKSYLADRPQMDIKPAPDFGDCIARNWVQIIDSRTLRQQDRPKTQWRYMVGNLQIEQRYSRDMHRFGVCLHSFPYVGGKRSANPMKLKY